MLEPPVTAADCAFGVAFPLTREEFYAQWEDAGRYELAALYASHFFRRLASSGAPRVQPRFRPGGRHVYAHDMRIDGEGDGPDLKADPWEGDFEETAAEIISVCREVRASGVEVVTHLSLSELGRLLRRYKVIAVLAHHRSFPSALELSDGFVDDSQLVRTMPPDFGGVLDLGTCRSGELSEALKAKARHSRIVHALRPTAAVFVAHRFSTAIRFLTREPEPYTDVIGRIMLGLNAI